MLPRAREPENTSIETFDNGRTHYSIGMVELPSNKLKFDLSHHISLLRVPRFLLQA